MSNLQDDNCRVRKDLFPFMKTGITVATFQSTGSLPSLKNFLKIIYRGYALDNWTEALDNGNSVNVLYLDFKKAFDSVLMQVYSKKVHAYSFRGDLFNWIRNFLIGC